LEKQPPIGGWEQDSGRFFDILAIKEKLVRLYSRKVKKGAWRMPWLSEAKKDVTSCEKLRGGANIHYIRGCPNGETHYAEGIVSIAIWKRTRRTETS
jgi:hypothetical protein